MLRTVLLLFVQFLNDIYAGIALLLGTRFLLRLLWSEGPLTQLILSFTTSFLGPLSGLFGVLIIRDHVLDVEAFIALLLYTVIFALLIAGMKRIANIMPKDIHRGKQLGFQI